VLIDRRGRVPIANGLGETQGWDLFDLIRVEMVYRDVAIVAFTCKQLCISYAITDHSLTVAALALIL
jgi:hypothetical protein